RERDTGKGRRFINILKELAFSKCVPGKWDDGLNLLREGFDEARRLNMRDEQAHMMKQRAFFYYSMDRKTEALQHWEEAIEIYRQLVAKSAYLYLPELVEALNFKAILLAELGMPLAAKIEFDETLRLARELFDKEPEVRSPVMAEVLNNYALFLTELKQWKEAEEIYKEAIVLYRGLSNGRYRISLAQVLNNSGNLMVSANRLDAAFPLHQEALHLRRLLFTANPGLYRAQLCQSLYNLALLMGEVGNYEEADKLYEEALAAISHLPDSELEFNWRLTVGTKISRSVPHSQSKVDTNVENGSSNPYKWRNRLPAESKMFFGRQREMRRLWDLLEGESPQHISIVGERRIGKSSLAYRLFHELKKETAALAIYLDCHQLPKTGESGDTQETFYRRLSRSFKEALATNNTVSETLGKETGEFGNYREFRRFVGAVSGNNIKLVMFLDEFEHLPKKGFADNSFFSNLRALGDAPDFSLAFVTLSKRKLKELTHQSIQTSGFYNIFETVIIGLLDHESIKQMRESGVMDKGFSLDAEERKKISYYAGDFAFLNMLVCYFLWEKKHFNETPDWDDLEDKLLQYYETLWDRSRDEQVLLKCLKKENDSGDFALKEMKMRGLLTKAGKMYFPFCDFFGRLIEETLEVRKKDISEKEILKTTKEVLDVLTTAKGLLPGEGNSKAQ
ncbi:MAG: tetratricopeptide repeat protein, partial [bacterium]|nr:tetratricopeptide repeat protein [bacterium]